MISLFKDPEKVEIIEEISESLLKVKNSDIYYFYILISQVSLEGIMIGLMFRNVMQECLKIWLAK